mmetsp:Transcript_24755/g.47473  ORF Transcript_24755/g.47473 Transcript_24755/m.47473 type:complete len:82 (-) Transcript_24755:208-453(-)
MTSPRSGTTLVSAEASLPTKYAVVSMDNALCSGVARFTRDCYNVPRFFAVTAAIAACLAVAAYASFGAAAAAEVVATVHEH